MPALFASFAALLLAVALLMASGGLLGSLLSLRAMSEGFDLQFAALLMSAFYAGMIIGTLRCGQLIDRVGHIRAFATFAATSSIVVLIMPMAVHPWVWLALRLVIGFNMAGLYMTIESWLNARADVQTRGTLMALYMLISYLALGSGQLLLDLYPIASNQLFMIVAMLLTAALIPVAMTRSIYPTPVETEHLAFRTLFSISPLGLLATAGAGMLAGGIFGLAPIFGRRLGLEVDEIALFMSVLVSSGLLLQLPIGRLSDRMDRRYVIAGVAVATLLTSLAIIPVTHYYSFTTLDTEGVEQQMLWLSNPTMLLVLAALYGALSTTLYPLSVAQTHDQAAPSQAVNVSAGLVLAYGCGAIFGPPAASALMGLMGPSGLFAFTGMVSAYIATLALWRKKVGEPVDEADKEQFVVMPEGSTSPAPAELDPRTAEDDEPLAATNAPVS